MQPPTIAILGGGFAGTMVAAHLLREARSPLRVVVVERESPARGVAYRDQPECHLLNVRAEGMSAFPDRPDHFLNWLNQQYSPCHPIGTSEFVPRRIYGAYIESILADAQASARRGVSFEVCRDEAIGFAHRGPRCVIKLASGRRLGADAVVLALGNPGPADPPIADRSFYSSPRYTGHAWSTSALLGIRRDEKLLLIGSGLTTLDWLVALRLQGHRGRIHVVSRRGLLPQLHRTVDVHHLSFDPLNLPAQVAPLFKRIRQEIASASAAGGDWRAVIDALRPYTQRLWQRLSLTEQSRFLRHMRPYWEIHRHRAAPSIVESVYELLRSGQLQITAARLQAFTETEDGVTVSLRARQGGDQQFVVDQVINCTGPESNYRRLTHPLVRDLREQSLIQPDALGLGLQTDSHGAVLASGGIASSQLFTLGPARKGQLWECTAVPEIRVQAQALAGRLLSLVATSPSKLEAVANF